MDRKRSRAIKLALIGTATLLVSGCGGCDDNKQPQAGGADFPNVDPVIARKAVAAGTGAVLSDAFLQGAGFIASSPLGGLGAPLDVVKMGMVIDMADETVAVTNHESGLARSGSGTSQTRHHYHYHRGPGIGWLIWGYALGRMTSGTSRPYTPPPRYGSTPRPYTSPGTGGSGFRAGSPNTGSSGRSGSPSTGSGGVSRGGFGSSGSAHGSSGGGS